jgi:hypothetical protein
MKHEIRTADCLTKIVSEGSDSYPPRKRHLLQFDGWSVVGDEELKLNKDENVSVYFEGDQGSLRLANPSDISEIKSLDGLESSNLPVDVYFANDAEQKARHHKSTLPEVFFRNKGKEDTFWFPSPTYLFDTKTSNLFAANSMDFDASSFVDGLTVQEDDFGTDEEVCNILNVVTGSAKIFKKEDIESELGERFHALRPVR